MIPSLCSVVLLAASATSITLASREHPSLRPHSHHSYQSSYPGRANIAKEEKQPQLKKKLQKLASQKKKQASKAPEPFYDSFWDQPSPASASPDKEYDDQENYEDYTQDLQDLSFEQLPDPEISVKHKAKSILPQRPVELTSKESIVQSATPESAPVEESSSVEEIVKEIVPEKSASDSPDPSADEQVGDQEKEEDRAQKPRVTVPIRGSLPKSFTMNPLKYHIGKPVLTDTVNVYYIWYGSWPKDSKAQTILENLIVHLDQTHWYEMMKAYYYQESSKSEKVYVNGKVVFKKSVFDKYSLGKNLKEEDVGVIVEKQIKAGHLPEDRSAVYFVLSSDDVIESLEKGATFGGDYCGKFNF
jgi:hypothetical protein